MLKFLVITLILVSCAVKNIQSGLIVEDAKNLLKDWEKYQAIHGKFEYKKLIYLKKIIKNIYYIINRFGK